MIYLVRYAEIALKGKNRSEFEKKLVENIRAHFKNKGLKSKINRLQGRLLVDAEKEADFRKVFGIASYSPCSEVKAELESLCSEALTWAEKHLKTATKTTTFRISARRITKDGLLSSLELNNKIGAFIVKKTGLKVNLSHPDLDIGIEIMGAKAFVFDNIMNGFGGLPVGIEGKVSSLISDEKSILAALLFMKRGCAIHVSGFQERNISLLQEYSPEKLIFHRLNTFPELIQLSQKIGCKALIVDDTLESLHNYPLSLAINMPILRSLIAFSREEIKVELEKYK